EQLRQLFAVISDAAAATAEGEARPQHDRIAYAGSEVGAIFEVVDELGVRHLQAHLAHGVLEEKPVLGLLDGLDPGAEELDAVLVEDASFGQLDRKIQPRLPADRGEQGVRTLQSDDRLEVFAA